MSMEAEDLSVVVVVHRLSQRGAAEQDMMNDDDR
jgi:hypothetical protein